MGDVVRADLGRAMTSFMYPGLGTSERSANKWWTLTRERSSIYTFSYVTGSRCQPGAKAMRR